MRHKNEGNMLLIMQMDMDMIMIMSLLNKWTSVAVRELDNCVRLNLLFVYDFIMQ